MKTVIARLILTGVLLYFIYGETGVFTTIAMFLLMLNSEMQAYISKQKADFDNIDNILKKIQKER